ncbi:peptidoglycan endopeptidase [Lutibacter sp. HS1-25]|uniref:C40 family peptidase n=1 Tax=Lutibacter sp. HS1-25 TaxID=2485000 RepID=UPI001012EACC|nr:C40 family peptidase [Lutibacter sp. HS1-25]RXP45859.1 peptidoglycan endopeptidase [Lutibacter sp. HS1-25]
MSSYKFFSILFFLISPLVFSQSTVKHKVSKGESIYSIAKKYDIKQADIYASNPKIKGKVLQINTVLLIPNTQNKSTNFVDKNAKEHTVASGESLYKISKKYGLNIEELKRLNPDVVNKLPIGYHLILKEDEPIAKIDTSFVVINEPLLDSATFSIEPSKTNLLIESASKKLGTRYKRGGTSSKGFDCSGFILSMFKTIDVYLPRSSYEQAKVGTKIDRSEAKKGDLIFFATNGKKTISHVGMIIEILKDEIKFIHSSTQLGVVISSTKEAYYSKRIVQVNRVL